MAYRSMWEIEVRHEGLKKYRHIRGSDRNVVERKAAAQQLAWEEMWQKKRVAEQKKAERESTLRSKGEKNELAITRTKDAEQSIEELTTILSQTLAINDAIDWSLLLDQSDFPKKSPLMPRLEIVPDAPQRSNLKYNPRLGIIERIFTSRKVKKIKEMDGRYATDLRQWEEKKEQIDSSNIKAVARYKEVLEKWESEKEEYKHLQDEKNIAILKKKEQYLSMNVDAISDYCDMVLSNSIYPDFFPQEWDLDYQGDSRLLIVDYSLPNISDMPTLKSVKYIPSRDEFSESYYSEAAINKLYDDVLYQIALRTVHELYEADVANALHLIVFNGWIDSVDKATGQEARACIMSLQASKDEFMAINLDKVDPKACFKKLKGVGSSKLHGLSPVAPIATVNKEDRRFVSAYAVMEELDSANNLAAMDWQDFENLIREIFEKEFSANGGEVKITQASRDGGVDAVAFDPDPIRGGKIVIQAKRYTNVVGLSAIRDLFGTTVNEGATKGILVTTADFGPDAYEFAKGKPLTLLNGSNLLHLLEKHGHKAKIDLKEAKAILSERDKRT